LNQLEAEPEEDKENSNGQTLVQIRIERYAHSFSLFASLQQAYIKREHRIIWDIVSMLPQADGRRTKTSIGITEKLKTGKLSGWRRYGRLRLLRKRLCPLLCTFLFSYV
jgi:hypothetical protein